MGGRSPEALLMTKLAILLAACGLALAACADLGSDGGPGRASPDPADQSPNH